MSRLIRVDPQDLRASAQRLSALVAELSLQKDQILESASGAPSYDGQFGPTVNALAAEAAAQVQSSFTRLGKLASELEAVAELFETADSETLQAIGGIWFQIEAEIAGFMTLLARLSPPGAPPAQVRLDLTLEEFQAMSAEQRIAWVEAFNEGPGNGWFSNFEDILHYFNDSRVFTGLDGSTPGSLWMAWGDAAVLQSVQDGYRLFLSPDAEVASLPDGTPQSINSQRQHAARLWEEFFMYRDRNRRDIPGLMQRWGAAEQAGVDYGIVTSDYQLEQESIQLSHDEKEVLDIFVRYGNVYRLTIANNAGSEIFDAMPRILAANLGQQLAEDFENALQDSAQVRFDRLSHLVEVFVGETGGQFIDNIGESLAGEDSALGQVDTIGEAAGGWAGQRIADGLEGPLEDAGQGFFDPRLGLGFEMASSSPIGRAELDVTIRGPLYHLSITVEDLLLSGNSDVARSFLDAVEETVHEVVGQGTE